MTDFVADVTTWVVITSTPETHLVQVDVGLEFTSLQTCVLFTDEADAVEYATQNGWVPPEDPVPELPELPEPE